MMDDVNYPRNTIKTNQSSLLTGSVVILTAALIQGCLPPPEYNSYPDKFQQNSGSAAQSWSSATSNPIADNYLPQHPGLSPNGRNGTHGDAYSSGTYSTSGPLGVNPVVDSAITVDYWRNKQLIHLAGECVSMLFDRTGTKMYATCTDINVMKLLTMDLNDNFNRTAVMTLPLRPNPGESLDDQKRDSSGGIYFHVIDDGNGNDQILTVDALERVRVIQPNGQSNPGTGADYGFSVLESYNIKPLLPNQTTSKLTDAMLDWNDSNLIWFIGKDGTVGLINRTDETIQTIQLSHLDENNQQVNEEIQNSLAADENGLLVVSSSAMYHFSANANNAPTEDWRTEYDRGGSASGTFSEGSGTTPTAIGPDYVAITDFSDPVKVVVYNRHNGVEVCNYPVFQQGVSSTENSLIGYYDTASQTASIIVENNFGYDLPVNENDPIPLLGSGVTRIDVSSGGVCSQAWHSNEVSPSSILKLSTGNGLIYIYTPEFNNGNIAAKNTAWYLTGLDFATGDTKFKVLTGIGAQWNVNYAAVAIGPDGAAYVGSLRGIISVKDN